MITLLRRYTALVSRRPIAPVHGVVLLLSGLFASGISAQRPTPRTPDIHFAATPQPLADAMLHLAKITRDDVVYDLG